MDADDQFGTLRLKFADFLDRLANDNRVSTIEWQRLVVAHYPDEFLEEIRRCTVRLMQDRLPYHSNTEPAREALRCWAMALRSSCSNHVEHPNDDVRLPDADPTGGNILVYAKIRDPERRDVLLHQFANLPGERVCANIFEIFTEDWDDGLWGEEVEEMQDLVDPATDTLIFWQVVDGQLQRTCIAGRYV